VGNLEVSRHPRLWCDRDRTEWTSKAVVSSPRLKVGQNAVDKQIEMGQSGGLSHVDGGLFSFLNGLANIQSVQVRSPGSGVGFVGFVGFVGCGVCGEK